MIAAARRYLPLLPQVEQVKIVLVAGFLGSGKTTTILDLAHYLTKGRRCRLAVLVNEAGDIPMDGAVLTAAGNQVKEIFAGCVCCQVATSLVTAVAELDQNYDLDYLLIEPSGLADPARVQMLLPQAGQETWRSIYIIDAPRFDLLLQAAKPVITKGIAGADVILLNKAELVEDARRTEIAEQLKAIQANAAVFSVSAQDGIASTTWQSILA